MTATRYQYDPAILDALGPADRRKAIAAMAELAGGVRANQLYRFDPLDPKGDGRPHLPQHRWLSAHHTPDGRPTKFRLLPGGNRGGKTTSGDVAAILDCVDETFVPPHLLRYKRWFEPISMYMVAPSQAAVVGIHLPIFRQWCPKDALVGGSVAKAFNKEFSTLHFKNGSQIRFMTHGMDVEVFQGTALHVVHFDEEPLHDHGQAIFTECMQRTVDYNGEVRFTFTPLNGMTWLYSALYEPWEQQQPEKEHATHGWAAIKYGGFDFPLYCHVVDQDDNPAIDEEGKAAALAMARSDEERRARKQGRFVSFAGRIFNNFNREDHVVPDSVALKRLRGFQFFIGGLDPGFRHMAGAVWVGLDEEGVWIVADMGQSETIIADVAAGLHRRAAELQLPEVMWIADPAIAKIDPQTGKTDATAYLEAGIRNRPGNNSWRASVNAIKSLCAVEDGKTRFHVAESCEQLISQMLRYRWATPKRSEHAAPEKQVKKDDHIIDAMRYAIMSLPIPEVATPDSRTPLRRALDADLERARTGAASPGITTIGIGQFD